MTALPLLSSHSNNAVSNTSAAFAFKTIAEPQKRTLAIFEVGKAPVCLMAVLKKLSRVSVWVFIAALFGTFLVLIQPASALTGAINRSYTFQAQTTDPESDLLYYNFNWGDGTPETRSPASGTVASGATVNAAHAWTAAGYYSVYVVACDPTQCSLQSDPFVMSIEPPTAPGKPLMTLGANPTASGIFTLEWNPSDPHSLVSVPVSISQYDVYRNVNGGSFSFITSVTSPKYVENGLPNGIYKYYIIARDDTVPTNFSPPSPQSDDIVVDSSLGANPPTADFQWCKLSSQTIQFEDRSVDIDGTVTAWDWDLGDSTSSTQQHPWHTYTGSGGSWWNTNWTRRRKITFDNSAQAENLNDFPVLVKLNSSRIDYAQTQNSGQDIRFIDADGATVLAHEIERWNESGDSFIWVRVPQIYASSNTDFIWMYYGNPSAPDGQNITGTWESNFKGVWHLQETSGAHQDSTSNNNDSIAIDVATQGSAVGKINGADRFSAASVDNVDIGDSSSLKLQSSESMTIEAWINASSSGPNDYQFIVNKKLSNIISDTWQLHLNPSGALELWMHDTVHSAEPVRAGGSQNLKDDAWHYVVGRWNKGSAVADVFVDGANVGTDPSSIVDEVTNTSPLVIGEEGDVGDTIPRGFNFEGTIDEVRFQKTVRSDAWIAAQYKSMNDTFIAMNAEEQQAPSGPYTVTLTVMDNGGTFSSPTSKSVDPATAADCTFTHTDTVASKCTEVGLQWTPATAASSYTIFRSDSGGSWTQRFSNISSVFYYDTTVSPLSSYQYYIQAVIPAGTLNASTNVPACIGGWSGNPTPQTFCPHPVPALSTPECAPTLNPLPPTSPCGMITLTWQPAVGATSYSVFRNTVSDFATATKIASGLTVTNYTDTAIVPEVIYYYYVTNQNETNPSVQIQNYSKSSCFRGTRWQER